MNAASAIRHTAEFYFCSDRIGRGYRVTLRAREPIAPISGTIGEILARFVDPQMIDALSEEAPDWRPMTDAEIERYEAADA